MKRMASLTLALLLLGGASAQAQTKVAVLGVEAVDASAIKAACLTEGLKSQVKLTADKTLVPGKGMDEIKLVMGCMDERPSCMARAGQSLNADKLLWGVLKKSAKGYDLTLKMLDVAGARIQRTSTETLTEQDLDKNCGAAAVQKLTRSFLAADKGSIKVTSPVNGAQVMLGLTVIGLTHNDPILLKDLPPGKYKIRIEKAGYKPWEQEVEVQGGETREIQAELVLFGAPPVAPVPPGGEQAQKDGKGKKVDPWKVAFWSGVAVTVGMAVGMGVSGGMVLGDQNDKEQFINDYRQEQGDNSLFTTQHDVCDAAPDMDPTNRDRLQAICDSGNKNATLTNVFLGLMLASAAASGFFYYKAYIAEDSPAPPDRGDDADRSRPETPVGEGPGTRAEADPLRWLVSPTASPHGAGVGFALQF